MKKVTPDILSKFKEKDQVSEFPKDGNLEEDVFEESLAIPWIVKKIKDSEIILQIQALGIFEEVIEKSFHRDELLLGRFWVEDDYGKDE
jgi:hypothetical protein